MNTGDTAFLLLSAALVMLMTPGLALFYGGMVRRKNTLGTIMQTMIVIALVSVEWLFVGYSLTFGPDVKGLIGDLSWFALRGVGLEPYPDYGATVPHQAFMIYQAMFAVITPALITGAFAERIKFSAFLLFIGLWSLLVYYPVAHWVWGVGGWIRGLGALDFAGGTVVHITSGASALAAVLVAGKRRGHGAENMAPHNLPMTVLGAGILWFGWFGFNAGSALSAGGLPTRAFLGAPLGASAAAALLGAASGAVAGRVALPPGAGFVGPVSAVAIGGVAGALCYGAVMMKGRLG